MDDLTTADQKSYYDPDHNYALYDVNTPEAVFISASEAGQKRKHYYDPNNNYAPCGANTSGVVFIPASKAKHKRKHYYDPNNNYALCTASTPGAILIPAGCIAQKRKSHFNPNDNYASCKANIPGAEFIASHEARSRRDWRCSAVNNPDGILLVNVKDYDPRSARSGEYAGHELNRIRRRIQTCLKSIHFESPTLLLSFPYFSIIIPSNGKADFL